MTKLGITFAGYQKPQSILTQSGHFFGQILEQELGPENDGGVDYKVIASVMELGYKQTDSIRLVGEGEFDIGYVASSHFTTRDVPEFGAIDLPFLFDDQAHAYRVIDGPLGKDLAEKINRDSPYQWLGYWCNGMRHFSNSVRPIRTPEDCKGLRMRALPSPLHHEAFRALGMEPEYVDIPTLLERAAATGPERIDAHDNALTNIVNFGIHELQPYITLSGHIWAPSVLLANKATYQKWPDHVKEAVHVAAEASTQYQRQLSTTEDERLLADLGPPTEVTVLTPEERAAFAAATERVIEAHRDEYGATIEQVRAARELQIR